MLKLSKCHISGFIVDSVLKNKTFKQLRELDFSQNFGIEKEFLKLSTSKTLKNLEILNLRNTGLTWETLEDIVASPNFSNVRELDIS